jgi:hypothetical protein
LLFVFPEEETMKKHWHMTNLTPCPFCHSPRQKLAASVEGLWAVVCDECGATGPSCYYKGEAVERWESMSPPKRIAVALGEDAGC